MKFNYLILFLVLELGCIKPLYKNDAKNIESIDFKINFYQKVQVSFKKEKINSNPNFFLQLAEKKNITKHENFSKGNINKTDNQEKLKTESLSDKTNNSTEYAIRENNNLISNELNNTNNNLEANLKSDQEKEKQIIQKKLLSKNLNGLNKIFAKRISEQSILKMKSIKTEVTIHSDSPDGYVNEKVNFILEKGRFNKIVKKFSLGDVKLTQAKIFDNCLDKSTTQEPGYICVVAYIEEIENTDAQKTIEIIYDYLAEDIVRKRDRPFSNKEQENNLLFIFDNYNFNNTIENLSLSMNFQHKIDLDNLTGYPERYAVEQADHSLYTIIKWENQSIKPNEFKNFALTMPLFTQDCLGVNEFHLEISSLTIIQIFLGIVLLLIFSITCIPYLLFKCDKKREEKSLYA